jgi:hypothetical protein
MLYNKEIKDDEMIKEIMWDIIKCKNIANCYSGCDNNCKCRKIIDSQSQKIINDFQVPEPWNGDIENAKILFISSNPSIDPNELYPLWDNPKWTKQEIEDFFINRFNDKWTKNYLHPKLKDGNYRKNYVHFWAGIRTYAADILNTNGKNIIPGKDYAITELVHCKSKGEEGVEEALNECANKYFEKIIEISKAQYYVAIGSKVKNWFNNRYKVNLILNEFKTVSINGRDYNFTYKRHPNARN